MSAKVPALPHAAIGEALKGLPRWKLEQKKLHREFVFRDFIEAFGFMASVALVAERRNHHPEWSNTYNRVLIQLVTHDADIPGGAVTQKDIDMAHDLEAIVRRYQS